MTRPANFDSGYVGMIYEKTERDLFLDLFRAAGIPVLARRTTRGYSPAYVSPGWGIYCDPRHVVRARELKRGFRAGIALRGRPLDFLTGFHAAMKVRQRARRAQLPAGKPQLGEAA